jgi:hypothetical protein
VHRLALALKYLWVFPATVVGLGLALIARAGGATFAIVEGVIEVGGGGFGRVVSRLPYPFGFRAITFGHVVIGVDRFALEDCREHERVHVRQYERWGVLFFPLYVGSSIIEALCGRDPYWHNHFEREARAKSACASRRPREHR